MQKTATTATIDLYDRNLNRSIEALIAREDALNAAAEAHGLDINERNALAMLRDATGFLDLMSEGLAKGVPFDGPEMVRLFQWTVMKLVEFNDTLPEELRGDLSRECFMRTKAAMTANGAH